MKKRNLVKATAKIVIPILAAFLVLLFSIAYLRYLDVKRTFIRKLSDKATSVMGQKVDVEDISIGPPWAINLYGITVRNPEGFAPGTLLRIGRIRLDLQPRQLIRGELRLKDITISSPELNLMKDEKGRFNISDTFLRSFSQKSKAAAKYRVEEFRVESGTISFNGDRRYRSDHINLLLNTLSSDPGTRTGIRATVIYMGNTVQMEGWAFLNEPSKRVSLSLSSRDFAISAFQKSLEPYKIDAENTRVNLSFRAEGDMEKGFSLALNLGGKVAGSFPFIQRVNDLQLSVKATLRPSRDSLTIHSASWAVDGLSTGTFRGVMANLKEKPSYRAEIDITKLDLAGLHFREDLRVHGIVTSKGLKVAGSFEPKMPEFSGTLFLRDGGLESPDAIVERINGDVLLSSGKGISIRGRAVARIAKAGGYLGKPVDANLTARAQTTRQGLSLRSLCKLSPLEVRIKGDQLVYLDGSNVMVEGTIKDGTFSGKNVLGVGRIRYGDRVLSSLKSSCGIDLSRDVVAIKDLAIQTEDFQSSASRITLSNGAKGAGYEIDIRNLEASYPAKGASLGECNLHLALHPGKDAMGGNLSFSVGDVTFQAIHSSHLSGGGRFDGKGFAIDLLQAEVWGGRMKLAVSGKIVEGPFPIQAAVELQGGELKALLNSAGKSLSLPYGLAANVERAAFEGTLNSVDSLAGQALVDARKVSVINPRTGQAIIKDGQLKAKVEFKERDLAVKADAVAGKMTARISGTIKAFLRNDRQIQLTGNLPLVKVADIRDSLWGIFPDSLLYVGLDGSIQSDFSLNYGNSAIDVGANLLVKDLVLEGENGEYSIGPINCAIPIRYEKGRGATSSFQVPSFARSQFDNLSKYYAEEASGKDLNLITIGSLRYGFPLLKDIRLLVSQKGNSWNLERFSANIYGGKIHGFATLDISKGLHYRAGLLLEGLSLEALCEAIEPIKGYLSGKVDGIASFMGSGIDLASLIGKADLWTYRSPAEKTMISRTFLEKIGGPTLKAYLGDRPYNKGIVSLYLKDKYLIFSELEISHRNFLGRTDLSIKVAPLNNRIAVDHLLWTIAEAAERMRKTK